MSKSIRGSDKYGKILVAEFTESEEIIFRKTVEWLSNKLSTTPATLVEKKSDLTIDVFTRSIMDKSGNHLYLTSKEFDFIHKLRKKIELDPDNLQYYYGLGYRV